MELLWVNPSLSRELRTREQKSRKHLLMHRLSADFLNIEIMTVMARVRHVLTLYLAAAPIFRANVSRGNHVTLGKID